MAKKTAKKKGAIKIVPVKKVGPKKVAAKKAVPKKTPKKLTEYYNVRFYNTLLSFEQRVKIGHPPEIGDVLYIGKRPYTEKLRGVIIKLSPLECLLDSTEDKNGNIVL